MNIKDMVMEAHQNARAHGWHDEKRTPAELLCLIHSEVSEVLEEIRNGKPLNENYYPELICKHKAGTCMRHDCTACEFSEMPKPEGVPSELADIVIRVADMCGLYGIDLEAAIIEKMQYNKNRPYRHGGKTL